MPTPEGGTDDDAGDNHDNPPPRSPRLQPTDLPFKKGDVITILARDDEEWWKGRLRLREGIIPRNYVEAHFT